LQQPANLELAGGLARELFIEHGLVRWSFGFDRAVRRAGLCNYRDRRITLSRQLVLAADAEQIRQVLLHEIAHALAGQGAGHGPQWRRLATSIGYRHERIDGTEVAQLAANWLGECSAGHQHFRQRRATQALSCRLCSPVYSSAHQISWRKITKTASGRADQATR
jgi:SprT protein